MHDHLRMEDEEQLSNATGHFKRQNGLNKKKKISESVKQKLERQNYRAEDTLQSVPTNVCGLKEGLFDNSRLAGDVILRTWCGN